MKTKRTTTTTTQIKIPTKGEIFCAVVVALLSLLTMAVRVKRGSDGSGQKNQFKNNTDRK
jgi:hypothetical protein